jgi:phospholipid/cholesterol/gamma-HCH transport system substrate-binding protein
MNKGLTWTSTKLALFTVVTIVITMWLASVIGNFRLFSEPYKVSAEFTDATGLLRGDVVKASGVTIGRVEEIAVERGIAVVTMFIDDDVRLPASVTAEIRFRNLVGQRMITIQEDTSLGISGELSPDEVIPLERTTPAFDLTTLFNGLRPLIRSTSASDINVVSKELTKALRGRGDEVEGFLTNLADISDAISERDAELANLLDNVNLVAENLNARDDQLQNTLGNLNEFLASTDEMKADLEQALVSLDSAAVKIARLIRVNDEHIQAELVDLRVLLDAVNDKRTDLRAAVRALPRMLIGVERVNSYGQWANIHLIEACKDDTNTCGTRGTP